MHSKTEKASSPNELPSTPNKDFGQRPKWYLKVAGKESKDITEKNARINVESWGKSASTTGVPPTWPWDDRREKDGRGAPPKLIGARGLRGRGRTYLFCFR
jgi:hypothetical protein